MEPLCKMLWSVCHLRFDCILHETSMAEAFHCIHSGRCNGCLPQSLLNELPLLRTTGCSERSSTAGVVRMGGSNDALGFHLI